MDLLNKDELRQKIDEAEVVLIGIGEEWTIPLEEMLSCPDMFSDIRKLSRITDHDCRVVSGKEHHRSYSPFILI